MHCTGASYNLLTNTGQGAPDNIPPSKWGNTSISSRKKGREKSANKLLVAKKCMKSILAKMTIVTEETKHAWLHDFAWGDL